MLIFNLSIDGLEIGQEVYFIQENKVRHGKVKSWGFTVERDQVIVRIDIEHLIGFREHAYFIPNYMKGEDLAFLENNEGSIEGSVKDFDIYLSIDDLISTLLDETA